MMTLNKKVFCLLILGIIFQSFTILFSKPLVSYRAWQFHEMDVDYVSDMIKLAPQYNINTVIFSHGMIYNSRDLYYGDDRHLDGTHKGKERGLKLMQLAREAHDQDLQVWIWVHELANVPQKYFKDKKVQIDYPGFWDWLTARYDSVFTDFPEFGGIILTFRETQYPVIDEKRVASKLSMPDRIAKLINSIDKVCHKHDKKLIVRGFFAEPIRLEWFKKALQQIDNRVIVQSKCVPHDWQPYYPHNSLIGQFPEHGQIIEFDCSSEFTGKNRVPHTSPEYFEYRWRYALKQPGIQGYIARVDHGGYDAIETPNEINLYTLYRLTEDPDITANDIWKEWTELRYGRKAALHVEKAFKPTFNIVNKSFFPLKFWITRHSMLPGFKYANGHISSRTLAKWFPEKPGYKDLENRLNHPDAELLEMIMAEKDTAVALSQQALQHLQNVKPYLTPGQYDDLYWRLELLERTAIIWKLHAEAFFGYKILAEGGNVNGLYQRVERAIHSLYRQAEVSAGNPKIGDDPPASAKEIRDVAAELEKLLNNLK